MQQHSAPYLKSMDLGSLLFSNNLLKTKSKAYSKRFKKGEYIYLPEGTANTVYLIQKGRVKIGHYATNGKELAKDILADGELFGELSLIGEKTRRDFAFAMEQTTCYVLPIEEIKALMQKEVGLSLAIMKIMGRRSLENERRLESFVFKDTRTRIIEFLIKFGKKRGVRVGFEILVRKFLTHFEIANLTATSRQSVTTVLNELRNKGLLTFNRKRLLIRDMEKLEQEIGIDYL